jgi:hypothetical protein
MMSFQVVLYLKFISVKVIQNVGFTVKKLSSLHLSLDGSSVSLPISANEQVLPMLGQ